MPIQTVHSINHNIYYKEVTLMFCKPAEGGLMIESVRTMLSSGMFLLHSYFTYAPTVLLIMASFELNIMLGATYERTTITDCVRSGSDFKETIGFQVRGHLHGQRDYVLAVCADEGTVSLSWR